MFNEELFLQIAKEMGIEVIESKGKDMMNGEEVDIIEIIFEPFNKSIEDMANEYVINNESK